MTMTPPTTYLSVLLAMAVLAYMGERWAWRVTFSACPIAGWLEALGPCEAVLLRHAETILFARLCGASKRDGAGRSEARTILRVNRAGRRPLSRPEWVGPTDKPTTIEPKSV